MKPLHVALIVIGVALAGGLAVRMTQPEPLQVTAAPPRPAPAPTVTPVSAPAIVAAPVEPVSGPEAAPAPVWAPETTREPARKVPAKPKPFATAGQVAKLEKTNPPEPKIETPPPASYEEPKREPLQQPDRQPDRQPEHAAVETPVTAPTPTPPPAPRQVVLQAGTQIAVRLSQTLSSDHLIAGDTFQATLAEPLVVDGLIVAERGARASGRIVDSKRGLLELALSTIQTADGQRVAVSSEPWAKQAASSRNEDIAKVGGGAALGAIIGAIAGGGMGAAIGAGVGGGAGVGAAAIGKPKTVNLPTETVVRFRLVSRVAITERQL